jgi:hypothetical protein
MQIKLFNLEKTSELNYEEKMIRDGYISWGEDNLWPKYLQSLMDKSSKHNAVIKSKASMIEIGRAHV